MNSTEINIPLPWITLAAKAWGDPSAPPMLALHGWLDNAGTFDRLAPLIEGRYIVAIDLPGHGRAEHRPAGVWYHYVDYLDEIQGVAEYFGWPKFSLLGHSLGGALASVYAAVFPECVEQLLLIEALGPLTATPEQAREQLRRGLEQRAAFAEKNLRVYAKLDDMILARQKSNDLSQQAAQCLVERGVRAVDGGFVWCSDSRLTVASPLRYTEAQILNLLAGIQAPTLLILADPAMGYFPASMVDARIAQVSNIQVVRLAGNHHLHLEIPEVVAKTIGDFLLHKLLLSDD